MFSSFSVPQKEMVLLIADRKRDFTVWGAGALGAGLLHMIRRWHPAATRHANRQDMLIEMPLSLFVNTGPARTR